MEVRHGYRFGPSDEELLSYLQTMVQAMVSGHDIPINYPVKKRDVYGDQEPWLIFDSISSQDTEDDEYRYVFTSLKKKFSNPNTKVLKRTAGCGSWTKERTVKIKDSNGTFIGSYASFNFQLKDGSSCSNRGTKSLCTSSRTPRTTTTRVPNNISWIIHEYTLSTTPDYAICKMRRMVNNKEKKSTRPCNPLDMYLSRFRRGSDTPLGFASDAPLGFDLKQFASDPPVGYASSISSLDPSLMLGVQVPDSPNSASPPSSLVNRQPPTDEVDDGWLHELLELTDQDEFQFDPASDISSLLPVTQVQEPVQDSSGMSLKDSSKALLAVSDSAVPSDDISFGFCNMQVETNPSHGNSGKLVQDSPLTSACSSQMTEGELQEPSKDSGYYDGSSISNIQVEEDIFDLHFLELLDSASSASKFQEPTEDMSGSNVGDYFQNFTTIETNQGTDVLSSALLTVENAQVPIQEKDVPLALNNNYHLSISEDILDVLKNERWKFQEDSWCNSAQYW